MTERCDLCGRAMVDRTLTPHYFSHGSVCERSGCRAVVADALAAVERARDRYEPLAKRIAARNDEMCMAPAGYRQDAMCDIDLNEPDWWATQVAKRCSLP